MEKAKQVGTSSSSFTVDLFGPKESSKSSSSFGSVFGPASTGLRKDSTIMGASRNQDSGSQCAKPGASDYMNQRSRGEISGMVDKDSRSIYQGEAVEPCHLSSSIYYGGQEVYSPSGHSTNSQHMNHFMKDGEEEDPNGNNSSCASRGNWWKGSLYY